MEIHKYTYTHPTHKHKHTHTHTEPNQKAQNQTQDPNPKLPYWLWTEEPPLKVEKKLGFNLFMNEEKQSPHHTWN